jgi:hypothetical protein
VRAIDRLPLLGLLLTSLAACSGPPPLGPLGEAAEPIIGGTVDNGDPAIVMLASYPPDESVLDTCTASLISSTVLLTAAHCVDATNHPDYNYGVFLGPDASAYATLVELLPELVPVAAVHPNPTYDPNAPFDGDIAVAVLAQPLATAPLPINRAPLTPAIVGQAARIVGYGQVVYGDYNAIKHQADTVVDSLGAVDTVVVGDATHRSCVGDSGGPALVEIGGVETIIGVDSYTNTTGCTMPANYRRPDVYLAFIDQYVPPPVEMDAGTDAAGPDAGSGGGGAGTGGSTGGATGAGGSSTTGAGGSASSTSGAGGTSGAGSTTGAGAGSETGATSGGSAATSSKGGCAIGAGGSSGGSTALAAVLLALALRRRPRR